SVQPPESRLVFNKIDRVPDTIELVWLRGEREQDVVHLSAVSGEGLARLDELVRRKLDARSVLADLFVSVRDGAVAAAARRSGALIEEEYQEPETLRLRLRIDEGALGNLQRQAGHRLRVEVREPAAEPRTSAVREAASAPT